MLVGLLMISQFIGAQDTAVVVGMEADAQVEATGADSLTIMAQDPGFIRVSLLLITPGEEAYSAWGHASLHLECPSQGLDYCFTFETMLTTLGKFLLFLRYPSAGFAAVPYNEYIKQYSSEGRGVQAYELNLLPAEKQALWRNLDEELGRGAAWKFDVTPHSCATMVTWVVQKSLYSGSITYHDLPAVLTDGDNDDVVNHCSKMRPWPALLLKMRLSQKGWRPASPERMMMPVLMGDAWLHATIDDGQGSSRPLVTGAPRWLIRPQWQPAPPVITPGQVGLILLVLLVGMFVLYCVRRAKRRSSSEKAS